MVERLRGEVGVGFRGELVLGVVQVGGARAFTAWFHGLLVCSCRAVFNAFADVVGGAAVGGFGIRVSCGVIIVVVATAVVVIVLVVVGMVLLLVAVSDLREWLEGALCRVA